MRNTTQINDITQKYALKYTPCPVQFPACHLYYMGLYSVATTPESGRAGVTKPLLLLAVEHNHISFALRRRHVQVRQLAALARSLDDGVARRVQLESHVPLVHREGGEQLHGAFVVVQRRHQHVVQSRAHEPVVVEAGLVVLVVACEALEPIYICVCVCVCVWFVVLS